MSKERLFFPPHTPLPWLSQGRTFSNRVGSWRYWHLLILIIDTPVPWASSQQDDKFPLVSGTKAMSGSTLWGLSVAGAVSWQLFERCWFSLPAQSRARCVQAQLLPYPDLTAAHSVPQATAWLLLPARLGTSWGLGNLTYLLTPETGIISVGVWWMGSTTWGFSCMVGLKGGSMIFRFS